MSREDVTLVQSPGVGEGAGKGNLEAPVRLKIRKSIRIASGASLNGGRRYAVPRRFFTA